MGYCHEETSLKYLWITLVYLKMKDLSHTGSHNGSHNGKDGRLVVSSLAPRDWCAVDLTLMFRIGAKFGHRANLGIILDSNW